MKAGTVFPRIQALHDLAKLATQMHMGSGGQFQQINPESHLNPQHIQQNMLPPSGHATAQLQASENPERFLSIMKQANIKKNRGVAF